MVRLLLGPGLCVNPDDVLCARGPNKGPRQLSARHQVVHLGLKERKGGKGHVS